MFKTEPRPYQRAIVEKTATMPYLALFLKQGLGKTKIALDTAAVQYRDNAVEVLIVISKTTVVENWHFQEVGEHLGVPYSSLLYSAKNRNKIPPPRLFPKNCLKVILMNDGCARTPHGYKFLEDTLNLYKCGLVIDESTIIKNPTSLIGKKMVKLGQKAEYRRILCGEPAPQGAVDYFNQYKFLHKDILGVGTFTAYKNIYCEQTSVWINGREILKPTQEFKPLAKDLFEQQVKPYTIRLRKEDVLPDLPEKQYIIRSYQLPDDVRKMYNKLREQFLTELVIADSGGTITATMAISRAIRLHQMVSGHVVADDGRTVELDSGRFAVLSDILDERPEGSKTIIWAHYRATIDQLVKQLEERYGTGTVRRIYGGLSDGDRQDTLSAFKSDIKVRYLVANPATAGWGLTLTEADAAVYYSNSYNWEHRDQSEDRIHRIGQLADSVQYFDIVAVDTVDQKILDTLGRKADFSKSVLTDYGEWFS
jgi:SNF2 family DNA or RNA helicase